MFAVMQRWFGLESDVKQTAGACVAPTALSSNLLNWTQPSRAGLTSCAPPALVGNCKIRDALRVGKSEGRPPCKFIRGANDAPQTFVTLQAKGRPLVSTFWCVHARIYVRQRRTHLRRCLRRESGGKP